MNNRESHHITKTKKARTKYRTQMIHAPFSKNIFFARSVICHNHKSALLYRDTLTPVLFVKASEYAVVL